MKLIMENWDRYREDMLENVQTRLAQMNPQQLWAYHDKLYNELTAVQGETYDPNRTFTSQEQKRMQELGRMIDFVQKRMFEYTTGSEIQTGRVATPGQNPLKGME